MFWGKITAHYFTGLEANQQHPNDGNSSIAECRAKGDFGHFWTFWLSE